jgi:radical SAM protein with 4Fe4S-binding SPASM domain
MHNDLFDIDNQLALIKSKNKKLLLKSAIHPDLIISTSPRYIILSLSSKCNLRCPHCAIHGITENKSINKDMEFIKIYPLIEKNLPFIEEYSLTVTGEPLLIKNFEDIVIKLSKFGGKLNLMSNGTLINEKNIDIIIKYSSNIGISIDGATPETLEILRKGANYSLLIKNIKYLVDSINKIENRRRPNVSILFTVMGSNINEMPEIIKLAYKLGIKFVLFHRVQLTNGQESIEGEAIEYHYENFIKKLEESKEISKKLRINLILPNFDNIIPKKQVDPKIWEKMIIPKNLQIIKNTIMESNDKINEFSHNNENANPKIPDPQKLKFSIFERAKLIKLYLIETAREYIAYVIKYKDYENIKTKFINGSKGGSDKYYFCESLYNRVYISNDGDVAPCCIFGRPVLGNIFNNELYDIWNGEKYRKFKQQFHSQSPPDCCKNCVFRQQLEYSSLISQ